MVKRFFTYNLPAGGVALGIGANTTQSVAIDNDAFFVLKKFTGLALTAALVDVSRQVSIQITDSDWSNSWFQAPMMAFHLFGQAGWPFMLPEERYLAPKCNVIVNIQNFSGVAITVWMEFHGYKILRDIAPPKI